MTDRETIRQIIAGELARPEMQRELPDRDLANTPNATCDQANWSDDVTDLTQSAQECAAVIQVIGPIALRQKAESRIVEIRDQEDPVSDAQRATQDFSEVCDLNG